MTYNCELGTTLLSGIRGGERLYGRDCMECQIYGPQHTIIQEPDRLLLTAIVYTIS